VARTESVPPGEQSVSDDAWDIRTSGVKGAHARRGDVRGLAADVRRVERGGTPPTSIRSDTRAWITSRALGYACTEISSNGGPVGLELPPSGSLVTIT
jgi:hypothetical protein